MRMYWLSNVPLCMRWAKQATECIFCGKIGIVENETTEDGRISCATEGKLPSPSSQTPSKSLHATSGSKDVELFAVGNECETK